MAIIRARCTAWLALRNVGLDEPPIRPAIVSAREAFLRGLAPAINLRNPLLKTTRVEFASPPSYVTHGLGREFVLARASISDFVKVSGISTIDSDEIYSSNKRDLDAQPK